MIITLRDEVLVVSDYEVVMHGSTVLAAVTRLHHARGGGHVTENRVAEALYTLVTVENCLEPWILPLNKKKYRRVADLEGYSPTKDLWYRLTFHGQKQQMRVMDQLVKFDRWRPVIKKSG